MSISDSFLDLLNLSLAVLSTVLLHSLFLFLLDGTGPNLNIILLFSLVELEGFSLATQDVGVKRHDGLVFDFLFSRLQSVQLLRANLLDTANK